MYIYIVLSSAINQNQSSFARQLGRKAAVIIPLRPLKIPMVFLRRPGHMDGFQRVNPSDYPMNYPIIVHWYHITIKYQNP